MTKDYKAIAECLESLDVYLHTLPGSQSSQSFGLPKPRFPPYLAVEY